MAASYTVTGIDGVPLVEPGDDLAFLLISAVDAQAVRPVDGDIFVIAQKVVSKAEGRLVALSSIEPSPEAQRLAAETNKEPRHVEVILRESREVVRSRRDVIIVEHRLGYVLANAGVDRSNVAGAVDDETVLLLPEDPDASADALKDRFDAHWKCSVGIVIADSVGRAWRLGSVGIAIGAAGVAALRDHRGDRDLFGRAMESAIACPVDAIASAATLAMGEADEGVPAAHVRGIPCGLPTPARTINRSKSEDMFR
ncbi:MAG: coenzyme F420-0:L-glutamate ligase [Hyphomicrobiaceae bacterium]|nr:coenzyme F420-0:L-glutamate ligase [Hyphomicrobiaceae bacterium]